MKRLIEYFIKYPVSGNVIIFLILALGYFGFISLKSTTMPQTDPGSILVTAQYPGASPEEIEQGIILKIETSLRGVSGIKKISSTSQENFGRATVEVISGYNTDLVLQDVRNAVDAINSFPTGMEPANVSKWEFRSRAIDFMISGSVDLKILKNKARVIEDDLRQIPGISKLTISGFPEEEIEISFREADLRAYNISFNEAANAIRTANIDLTGGTIRGENEELFIRTKQKQFYANDLKSIILRTSNTGAIVRLSDVAKVTDKWSEDPNRVFVNGNPAVLISVQYTASEDIIQITDSVKEYINVFNAQNDVVQTTIINDESVGVRTMQRILLNNGLLGFLFVMLFLTIFLNRSLSFWVAISIPLSFMGMFFLSSIYGLTLNRMSLFGMILVIGILVDDGIVIGENIYQHHEKGKKPVRAAIDGTLEVIPAVFAAVLTTIIAFTSILLVEGIFGQLFREMAFVVIATLAISLIEGALILPAHIAHSKIMAKDSKLSRFEQYIKKQTMNFRDKFYMPILKGAINNKLLTLTIVTGLFFITVGAVTGGIIKMGSGGFRNVNYANVSIEIPPGTPEKLTLKVLDRIESSAKKVGDRFNKKEGKTVVTSIVKSITSTSTGSINVNLINTKERSFISTDFSNALRKEVGLVPEALRVNYVEQSHFGKPVSVSLLSNNFEELNGALVDLKYELEQLSELKNVIDNNQVGMREIKVVLKDKAFLLGLNLQEVMSQVRSGFFGAEVQRINRGLDEVRIWVRYEKEDRATIGNLEDMRIRTVNGLSVPLNEIAVLTFERNLTSINHLNGRRAITVEADAIDKSVNIAEIKGELKNVILPKIRSKYPSIQYYFGGRQERMNELMDSLKLIFPVIIVLLFAVISLTFRSFLQALLIFGMIPLGFIGLGWGHAIHGVAIDMPSYFGILALLGIIVNDSIVLINTLNRNLRNGDKFMDAVLRAGSSRFRPIVLTSLTTMAGLFPLILANDPDAQHIVPMAISVAYGVLVATFLTLLVLPVLLVIINSMKCQIEKFKTGDMPSRESVERAVQELDINNLI
jgi:multidrug efflux pump subunit AcrB